ncbi:transcriptional regulator, partial [Sulfurovum sp. bin170]|uniref:transcriptional regulator n=1 Tax=Sulfurovum sp. bin170 TaxID=2695268 RepID=UPI0013DE7F1C
TIAKLELTTKTQIVRDAIVEYIANLKKRRTHTPYSLGHDLFGVYDGDEELSSDYKNRLDKILDAKYPH